jgi:hypothetical protein
MPSPTTTTLASDLVIYGGTPAGISCAVRAARDGARVLIVTHTPHLGGMLTSGLCTWDTQHEGLRSPVYDELRSLIFQHYRGTYGEDSAQYRACLPGTSGHNNGNFEPRVAQQVIERLVASEPRITVRRRHLPVATSREGRILNSVTFREIDGAQILLAQALVFCDCSYEGDLMHLAGIRHRSGREGRGEYHEAHAGRIFMRPVGPLPESGLDATATLKRSMPLRQYADTYVAVDCGSAGEGDECVQAFNWRTVLTDDASNRMPIPPPRAGMAVRIAGIDHPGIHDWLPNRKIRINRPQLVGLQHAYAEGSWSVRHQVMDDHWNAFLAVMQFLQHDARVPEEERLRWRQFGLAKDEFADHGHRPYEIYVRESRRLLGRFTFSEHDATLAPGILRAPIHDDSIGISEWYIDIHACTDHKMPGTLHEGKVILQHETFPGQVPLRSILPMDLDNVLIPVCLSATHVGWGTIRLEPTWMNIAESAGVLAAMAVRSGVPPAKVDLTALQLELSRRRIMLGFLNDAALDDADAPAVQFFSTKGFFPSYDARLSEPLEAEIGTIWVEAVQEMTCGHEEGDQDAQAQSRARRIFSAQPDTKPMTWEALGSAFAPAADAPQGRGSEALTRRQALAWLFMLVQAHHRRHQEQLAPLRVM